MKISINPYDAKSVDNAINKIVQFKSDFEMHLQNASKTIADLCRMNIEWRYGEVEKNVDDEPISVTTEVNGDTIIVRAEGEDLFFIEFGAGLIGYGNPMAQELGYGPGSWSTTQGAGRWANPYGWFYRGSGRFAHTKMHSRGNRPARAFYDAILTLQMQIDDILIEEFRNDR